MADDAPSAAGGAAPAVFAERARDRRPVWGQRGAARSPATATEGVVSGLVLDVLAHELAHYEQFKLGLKVQERGVAVRARRIRRRVVGR